MNFSMLMFGEDGDIQMEVPIDFNISEYKLDQHIKPIGIYGYMVSVYSKNGKKYVVKSYKSDMSSDCIKYLMEEHKLNVLFSGLIDTAKPGDYGYDVNTQRMYISTEYIPNSKDLMCYIEEDKKFDYSLTRKLAIWLFTTLKRIHACGYLHIDIKPENILYDGENFYLIDFGSCRLKHELNEKHINLGTPGYFSPLKNSYYNNPRKLNNEASIRLNLENDVWCCLYSIYGVYTLCNPNDFNYMKINYPFFYELFVLHGKKKLDYFLIAFRNWKL